MKTNELTLTDIDILIESLKHSAARIASERHHPSYEFKQQQLKKVNDVAAKIRAIKTSLQSS